VAPAIPQPDAQQIDQGWNQDLHNTDSAPLNINPLAKGILDQSPSAQAHENLHVEDPAS
jgi:hypothetical protein